MQIIGLVGEKGSGKDTFANTLKKIASDRKIAHIRFSDLLKETLNSWDIPQTRHNLQLLAQIMEKGFGPGTVANSIYAKVKKISADIVILDGIRWNPDVELLKKFQKSLLVYITADAKTRYIRLKSRGEKKDEANTSFEQFMEEEKAENEVLIPGIGKNADFKIENKGSISEFEEKIRNFYTKIRQ